MHGLETEEAEAHSPDELLASGPPKNQKTPTRAAAFDSIS